MLSRLATNPDYVHEVESVTVKLRDELHISRKLFHVTGVFFIVIVFNLVSRNLAATPLLWYKD